MHARDTREEKLDFVGDTGTNGHLKEVRRGVNLEDDILGFK